MLAPQTFRTAFPIGITTVPTYSSELSRLFAAAIVNQQFCDMLLENPKQALQNGYLGESFLLSSEEKELIISIHAETLSDLAQQVYGTLRNHN